MKQISLKETIIDFYFNFFGLKRSKEVIVEEVFYEPDSIQEELEINFLYHKTRKDYLVKLNELDNAVNELDHIIDCYNKEQAAKFCHRRISLHVIRKDRLSKLMCSIDEMINVIKHSTLSFPMREFDYITLRDFDHFFKFASHEYEKVRESLSEKVKQINVTL